MHRKQNNKESKTYVQGLRPFGNVMPRSVKGILKKSGYNYSEIINRWDILVGKKIASCSYPKSIKTGSKDSAGILTLRIKRGDEINVEYSKHDIINKINSYFGYKVINEIKLQTFNYENKKNKKKIILTKVSKNFEEKINKIKNKNIRNSLSQLIRTLKND